MISFLFDFVFNFVAVFSLWCKLFFASIRFSDKSQQNSRIIRSDINGKYGIWSTYFGNKRDNYEIGSRENGRRQFAVSLDN